MQIAFFDFDGTITNKDSFLQFIRFSKGNFQYYFGMLLNVPFIVAFKLKLIPNWKAKELVFTYFFKGVNNDHFSQNGKDFADHIIPEILRPEALAEIKKHQQLNTKIVVVTASFSVWIEPWCKKNGFELIATEHEVIKSQITGKIHGKNCHGKEKIRRIMERYNLKDYSEIFAYGDSRADLDMLSIANHKWMKWRPVK